MSSAFDIAQYYFLFSCQLLVHLSIIFIFFTCIFLINLLAWPSKRSPVLRPLLIFITSFIILHPRSRVCLLFPGGHPVKAHLLFFSVCLFSTHSPSPIPNCQLINIDSSANSHAARPLLVWNQYIKLVKLLVARLLHQQTKNRLYQTIRVRKSPHIFKWNGSWACKANESLNLIKSSWF